jgi:hypothetical protein
VELCGAVTAMLTFPPEKSRARFRRASFFFSIEADSR